MNRNKIKQVCLVVRLLSEFHLIGTVLCFGACLLDSFAGITHTVCVYWIACCAGVWASPVHTYTYPTSSSLSARQFRKKICAKASAHDCQLIILTRYSKIESVAKYRPFWHVFGLSAWTLCFLEAEIFYGVKLNYHHNKYETLFRTLLARDTCRQKAVAVATSTSQEADGNLRFVFGVLRKWCVFFAFQCASLVSQT